MPVLHIHGRLDPCWPYDGGEGMCVSSQEGKGTYAPVPQTIAVSTSVAVPVAGAVTR